MPSRRTILVLALLLAMLGAWLCVPSLRRGAERPSRQISNGLLPQLQLPASPPTPSTITPPQSPSPHHPAFTLVDSTPQELYIRFDLPEYSIEEITAPDGFIWHRITAQGTHRLDHAGAPALPVFRTDIAMPNGSDAILELVEAEYITIEGITPEPGAGPCLTTVEELPNAAPDSAIYEGTAPYPADSLCLASNYQIRHTNGYGIVVSPFQYLPDRHELRVMTSASIVVRATGDAGDAPKLDAQTDFANIQRRTFLNVEALRNVERPAVGTLQIVYPSKWTGQIQTSLDNFVEWKRQIGWTVQTAGYPADTGKGADALTEYLQAQYDATAFTHLVLIGDYNAIPPYQHQGTDEFGRNAEKAFGNTPILYTLCASDIPYAFLDGTDDLLYPDAFVSRLPVSTYAHINNLLSRLHIIEQGATLASQTNPDWLTSGIFMGSNDSSSNTSNPYYGIKDKTIVAQACAKLQEAGIITSATELYAAKDTPTADDVIDAVNAGASTFYYLGHGTCTSFITSGFASADIESLSNKLMLPYIVTPNCSSGNLEHGSSWDVSTHAKGESTTGRCLVQALFDNQSNTTVQAVIASTEVTFWTPPIVQLEAFADLQAQWKSAEHLATSGAYATGSLNTAVNYCETFYDNYHRNYLNHNHALFEAWEMHLYGDASAVPRFGPLHPLTVSTTTIRDTATVEITVTGFGDETPVPNAAVCIESDGEYYSTRTDANGKATIHLPTASNNSVTLRVLDASAPLFECNVSFLPEDAVTTNGATVSVLDNSTVVFTAILPDGTHEDDYEYSWTSDPEVEFSGCGRTVSVPRNVIYAYIWQGLPVTVVCDITGKENTATRRTLHLQKGWNLVMLSLLPDTESLAKLNAFTAWTLNSTGNACVKAQEFFPHDIYWLYVPESQTLVLTGAPAETPLPQADGWCPYGAYPATRLQDFNVWKWQDGQLVPQTDSKIEPGYGYFIHSKKE